MADTPQPNPPLCLVCNAPTTRGQIAECHSCKLERALISMVKAFETTRNSPEFASDRNRPLRPWGELLAEAGVEI